MKTRDRILDAARILYNQHGVANVSVQDICNELNISKGNFWYHFQSKEFRSQDLIILELYQQMMQETGKLLDQIPRNQASIRYFLETHQQVFLIQTKYKFFYLNLFEILGTNAQLKQQYVAYRKMGEELAHELLKLYLEKGVLEPSLRSEDVKRLLVIGQILDSFWAIDAEIFFQGDMREKMIHYLQICCGLLLPYLTPSATAEYEQFFEEIRTNSTFLPNLQ